MKYQEVNICFISLLSDLNDPTYVGFLIKNVLYIFIKMSK